MSRVVPPGIAARGQVSTSFLIYACAFAVAGATPFVLLPILTKVLSPVQFGEVTAFLMLTAMVGSVASLSTHGLVSVRYFKSDGRTFASLVSTSVVAIAAAHAVAAALVLVSEPALRRAFELPLGWMLFAVVAAFLLSLNLVFLAIFQAADQPLRYLGARVVQAVVEITLCVAAIWLIAADPGARVYSYAAALAASAAVGIHYCLRRGWLGVPVSRARLVDVMRFGTPMLPHIMAGTAIVYIDRLMVSTLLGVESLGIYMVAMQIGMVMVAIIEPLNKALAPWLFAQLSKEDHAVRFAVVRRTYALYAALVAVGAAVATIACAFFDVLVGHRYAAARVLIPWIITGFVLQGMYYTVVNYLFYAERTGRLSIMSSLTAVIACATSYLLIPRLGLIGAGVSFVVSNALLFALVWLAASHAVAMPWRLRNQPR